MSNKKYKSIIPKNTVLPLALLILVIVFGVLYILVDKNADDKDYKVFDVVTPLLALVISVIGSIYVYNAYNAQQEQIKIQKDEIENNRQDAEFNRVLDIVYQHSNKTIKDVKDIKKHKLQLKHRYNPQSNEVKYTKYEAINYLTNDFDSIEQTYEAGVKNIVDELYPKYLENFKILFDLIYKELEELHQGLIIYETLINNNILINDTQKRILNNIVNDLFFNEIKKYYSVVDDKLYKLYKSSLEDFKYIQDYSTNEPEHNLVITMRINKSIYEGIKNNIAKLDFLNL